MSTRIATKKSVRPSNEPQNFNHGRAWYYESNASIEVYRSLPTLTAKVGRLTIRQLSASLERMGYKVTKEKP